MKNNRIYALPTVMETNGTKLMERKYVLTYHCAMKDREQLKMTLINVLINVIL